MKDQRSITSIINGRLGGRPKELFDFEEIPGENWRVINGYDNYFISDSGRVISIQSGKIRIKKNIPDKDGYADTILYKSNNGKHHKVHRMVLELFKGPCPDGMEASHLDQNKKNNHISNLTWESHKSNIHRSIEQGIGCVGKKGQDNSRAKLTANDVLSIREKLETMSQSRIATMFGVNQVTVSLIAREVTWKNL